MDLAEVELVDQYMDEPRGNDTQLLAVCLIISKAMYVRLVDMKCPLVVAN